MIITPIKTRKLIPPQDDLDQVLKTLSLKIKERTIVAISSKIVSILEGRCIHQSKVKDKDELIIKEAEKYLDRNLTPGGWIIHTLKNNLLIPTSGVDESNANGYYILWPKNPKLSAKRIWQFLKKKSQIKNLGVIITDSHSIPLRRGLVGISLAHFGFQPLKDYRGKQDLFGRRIEVSLANIPDSLAAASVLAMGEGAEQTPIALISDLGPAIKFTPKSTISKKPFSSFGVPTSEDLFKPFLDKVPWKKGGSGH